MVGEDAEQDGRRGTYRNDTGGFSEDKGNGESQKAVEIVSEGSGELMERWGKGEEGQGRRIDTKPFNMRSWRGRWWVRWKVGVGWGTV